MCHTLVGGYRIVPGVKHFIIGIKRTLVTLVDQIGEVPADIVRGRVNCSKRTRFDVSGRVADHRNAAAIGGQQDSLERIVVVN